MKHSLIGYLKFTYISGIIVVPYITISKNNISFRFSGSYSILTDGILWPINLINHILNFLHNNGNGNRSSKNNYIHIEKIIQEYRITVKNLSLGTIRIKKPTDTTKNYCMIY